MRPAIQLYTLRDLNEPLSDRLKRVADLGYEGVEFAGLYDNDAAQVSRWLDNTNLRIVGAHVSIDQIENEYDDVVETYRTLDCPRLIIPWYEQAAFESREGVREVADHLTTLADRLDADGFDLFYHNHSFEFTPFSNGTAFDQFVVDADGVSIEFDTGLAAKSNMDPSQILRRYEEQIELVHLTDTRADCGHVNMGTGIVDMQACVDAANDTGTDWIIFENGSTENPIQSTEKAIKRISEYIS